VFLYYSDRRQVPAPLQAFVSFVRRHANSNGRALGAVMRRGAKADGHAAAGAG